MSDAMHREHGGPAALGHRRPQLHPGGDWTVGAAISVRDMARHYYGEVVFVPDDPPRAGRFAVLGAPGRDPSYDSSLQIVTPVGAGIRRTKRPARFLSIAEAIPAFLKADVSRSNPSTGAWATATRAGLGLIAR